MSGLRLESKDVVDMDKWDGQPEVSDSSWT